MAYESLKSYAVDNLDVFFVSNIDGTLLTEILKTTSKRIFIPITAGGGIRCVKDAAKLSASCLSDEYINQHVVITGNQQI